MQATGMVNDHLVSCHRHAACAKLQRRFSSATRRGRRHERQGHSRGEGRRARGAPGSACCPVAGSICSIPPPDIEIEDIAHGLARVARWNGQTLGEHAFSVAQHALLVEEIATRCTPI